jgi:hypothetical protein
MRGLAIPSQRPCGGQEFPPYGSVFDLMIIGKTLAVVWRDQNAY